MSEYMEELRIYITKFWVLNKDALSLIWLSIMLICIYWNIKQIQNILSSDIDTRDFTNIETLKNKYIKNWYYIPMQLQAFISSCSNYSICNSKEEEQKEIILYKNGLRTASMGVKIFCNDIYVISINAGKLFQWNIMNGFTSNNLFQCNFKEISPDNISFFKSFDTIANIAFKDGSRILKGTEFKIVHNTEDGKYSIHFCYNADNQYNKECEDGYILSFEQIMKFGKPSKYALCKYKELSKVTI